MACRLWHAASFLLCCHDLVAIFEIAIDMDLKHKFWWFSML